MNFGEDERGVSIVIGAVLLFAVLVISLSLYQATAVPSQNAEIEFKHSVQSANQFVSVRNAILAAKESGVDGYVTIDLGVQYPSRMVAVNPPPVSGSLRTSDPKPITVLDGSGQNVSDEVCPGVPQTRLLTYQANYHAYQHGPKTTYEHSVVYNQFGDVNVPLSGQTLVQGDEIDLTLLQTSYAESGVGAVAFEPKAGQRMTSVVQDPTLVLPTRLSEDDWEQLLAQEVGSGNVTVTNGTLTVSLTGERTIDCGAVGAGSTPPGGSRQTATDSINPVGPGAVRHVNTTLVGGGSKGEEVRIKFENTANRTVTLQKARISFFFDSHETGSEPVTQAEIRNETGGNVSAVLEVEGEAKSLRPPISFPANETGDVFAKFDTTISHDDFFVVYVTFGDGRTSMYFIAPE